MNGSIKLDEASYSRVVTGLHNIGQRVPSNAARAMRRAAERIVKNAKLYVPEDTSALMQSIRLETSLGQRGRLQINVIAGGQTVVNVNGRQVDLDQYAAIIHEHYEDMLVYGPGERTLEKMAANPGKVGSGFLRRAAVEEAKVFERDLIEDITRTIKSEGF